MIYTLTPYYPGDLGKAYNDSIEALPKDSLICLIDSDVMFLHSKWGEQLREYHFLNNEYDLLTCYTNRVGNLEQCFKGEISNNKDITYHYTIAALLSQRVPKIIPLKNPISGMVMFFSRKTWKKVGGFKEGGILGIDNDFSSKCNKVGLMTTVYAFHYYRLHKKISDKTHLI